MPKSKLNFVSTLWSRQLGFPSQRTYFPESSFSAFSISACNSFYRDNQIQSPPLCLVLSDRALACTNDGGDVKLFEKETLNQISHSVITHNGAVFGLKWRFDNGEQLLSASNDHSIALWSVERAFFSNVRHYTRAHDRAVRSISFHDTNIIASGGSDGCVKLWDLRNRSSCPVLSIKDAHREQQGQQVRSRVLGKVRYWWYVHRWPKVVIADTSSGDMVTCVHFHPTFRDHLYSCGLSDSAIKVWDIRKVYTPVKRHSVYYHRNAQGTVDSENGPGFYGFIFQTNSKYGNVLLANATDSRIYAFADGSKMGPSAIFSGRNYTNRYMRLSTLGDHYLVSGAVNSRAYIWNSSLDLDSASPRPTPRSPLYQLQFNDFEEITGLASEPATMSLYNACSNSQLVFKWDFFPFAPYLHYSYVPTPVCKPWDASEDDNNDNLKCDDFY